MDKRQLWHIFERTGKVADYLNFVRAEQDESAEEEIPVETYLRGACDMADQDGGG